MEYVENETENKTNCSRSDCRACHFCDDCSDGVWLYLGDEAHAEEKKYRNHV